MLNKQYNFVRITALEVCKLLSTLDYVGKGRTERRTGLNMPFVDFYEGGGPFSPCVNTDPTTGLLHALQAVPPRNVCE